MRELRVSPPDAQHDQVAAAQGDHVQELGVHLAGPGLHHAEPGDLQHHHEWVMGDEWMYG